jgi:MoaA/NifB/PqqE/SkfB family radical SAM enzyme
MIPQSNEVRFEISTACNYDCLMCARGKFTREREVMPTSKFRTLLDKLLLATDQYKVCTFSGFGEPLIDTDIVNKMTYAKSRGLRVLLLTNGSLLTKDLCAALAPLVDNIRVSFYGMTPEVYRTVHGVDKFDKVRDIINTTASEIKYIVNWLELSGINCHQTKEFLDYWDGRVYGVEAWHPHNWGDIRKYRRYKVERLRTCGRPFSGPTQVQVNGDLVACCFDLNSRLLYGNLFETQPHEIFESAAYKKICKSHVTGKHPGNVPCCKCDQLNKNKTGILIYSSFKQKDREQRTSTTYENLSSSS